MASVEHLNSIASQVRRDILRMVHGAKSGHPGGSLGCADYLVGLYFDVMQFNEKFDMDGANEDIFFLSNGHVSPLWYSVLARKGFFDVGELGTFRKLHGRLQGHPATAEGLPGIRMASGSLGQGMSVAIGAALAKKLNQDEHLVYSLHGDGEMQEGQNWEALMFAAHHKVDNIVITVDYNGLQIDGPTKEVMDLGNIAEKIRSFGWVVTEMNGNDMENVISTLYRAKAMTGQGQPVAIVMQSEMGSGVDFMTNHHHWHGVAPNDEQLQAALAQLEETLGDY